MTRTAHEVTALETLRNRYRSGGKLNAAEKLIVDAYLLSRNNVTFADADLERAAEVLVAKDAVIEVAQKFMDDFLIGEYCPNCLNSPEYHDEDCGAGNLVAALKESEKE